MFSCEIGCAASCFAFQPRVVILAASWPQYFTFLPIISFHFFRLLLRLPIFALRRQIFQIDDFLVWRLAAIHSLSSFLLSLIFSFRYFHWWFSLIFYFSLIFSLHSIIFLWLLFIIFYFADSLHYDAAFRHFLFLPSSPSYFFFDFLRHYFSSRLFLHFIRDDICAYFASSSIFLHSSRNIMNVADYWQRAISRIAFFFDTISSFQTIISSSPFRISSMIE